MLKQKARTVALAVLVTDLALTAVSLPVTWVLRHGVLTSALPTVFPLPLYPLNQYLPLLSFVLPIWGLLLYAAGFYRSHRTLPLGEELWAAAKVSFGGTAILVLLIYGLRLDFVSRWFLVLFGFVNFLFLASEKVALRLIVALGPLARLQLPNRVDRRDRAQGRPVRRLPGSPPALGLPGDRLPRRRQRGRDPRQLDRWPCMGHITDMGTVLGREVIDEVIFVIEKGKLGEYEEALLVAERHGVPRARLARHLPPRAGAADPRGARRDPAALVHDDPVEPR